MGVKEGRAFSSDLHSANESFRISLHFKEKMPSLSAAPPRHAGQAEAVLALLTCKWREQGAHASPPTLLKTCRGDFKARHKGLATQLPLTVIAAEQPNPQAELPKLTPSSPKDTAAVSAWGTCWGFRKDMCQLSHLAALLLATSAGAQQWANPSPGVLVSPARG